MIRVMITALALLAPSAALTQEARFEPPEGCALSASIHHQGCIAWHIADCGAQGAQSLFEVRPDGGGSRAALSHGFILKAGGALDGPPRSWMIPRWRAEPEGFDPPEPGARFMMVYRRMTRRDQGAPLVESARKRFIMGEPRALALETGAVDIWPIRTEFAYGERRAPRLILGERYYDPRLKSIIGWRNRLDNPGGVERFEERIPQKLILPPDPALGENPDPAECLMAG